MKDLTRVVVLVSLLGLGSVARAQGVLERGTSWVREDPQPATLRPIRSRASHRERAYGSSLAAALGQTTTGPVRVTQRFAPDSAPGTQVTARGVRVALGDATEVDRLFFPDAQAAFLYALYAAETDGPTDAIVEARGNQVVVVRSTGLGDPERTADLLDAAWGAGSRPRRASRPSARRSSTTGRP